jgi:hypothetical protein
MGSVRENVAVTDREPRVEKLMTVRQYKQREEENSIADEIQSSSCTVGHI